MEEAQKIDDLNPLTLVQLCDELDKCSQEDLQRYGILHLLKLELNKRLADFFS